MLTAFQLCNECQGEGSPANPALVTPDNFCKKCNGTGKLPFESAATVVNLELSELSSANEKLLRERNELTEQITRIEKIVREHEGEINWIRFASLPERIKAVLQHYQDNATNNLAGVRDFRNEVIVQLRALSMLVDVVGSASTHGEKAARLRGMSELLESAISKLTEWEFNFSYRYWYNDSVFRSDYPTRKYVQRIHELESVIKQMKEKEAKANQDKSSDELEPEEIAF